MRSLQIIKSNVYKKERYKMKLFKKLLKIAQRKIVNKTITSVAGTETKKAVSITRLFRWLFK